MLEVMALTIGQVSERAGVATSAIRFYEARGLIDSDRTTGNQQNDRRCLQPRSGHTTRTELESASAIEFVSHILEAERDLVIASPPLEATAFEVDGLRMTYVFYQSGLAINVMYAIEDGGKRAVGFKLSDGMEVPAELAERFKFARQKSKLAGTIRGSYFVIKGEY